jgi:hypothetical protein
MRKLNEGHTSFQFLKTDSQLLETGLETPPANFFLEISFYELLLKSSFYKNSMDSISL